MVAALGERLQRVGEWMDSMSGEDADGVVQGLLDGGGRVYLNNAVRAILELNGPHTTSIDDLFGRVDALDLDALDTLTDMWQWAELIDALATARQTFNGCGNNVSNCSLSPCVYSPSHTPLLSGWLLD
jgi:hypothetical protein